MKFKDGQAVRHNDGRIGIVCDDHIRQSGPHKGKLFVLFVGALYGCGDTCYPSDLTHTTIVELVEEKS